MTPEQVDKTAELLAAILHRHLKSRPENHGANVFMGREIASAFLHAESRFGLTVDLQRLERLQGAARTLESEAEALSYATKWEIANLYEDFSLANVVTGEWKPGALDEFLRSLGKLRENLDLLRRIHASRPTASAKRNWSAVAVTDKCLCIWRRDKWELADRDTDLGEYFDGLDSDEQLFEEYATFEPLALRYHDPGPFGRFLEEVFMVLGIMGKDGHPVRAANALASLRDLQRQENRDNI